MVQITSITTHVPIELSKSLDEMAEDFFYKYAGNGGKTAFIADLLAMTVREYQRDKTFLTSRIESKPLWPNSPYPDIRNPK